MSAVMQQTIDRQKMRRQAYLMIPVIIIGMVLGAYLVASGALPDQYVELTVGNSVPHLKMPDGFELTVFVKGLAAPRYLAIQPETNVLFASERGAGRVIALPDADQDGIYDEIVVAVDNLTVPTGLTFNGEWLYIAEGTQIIRVRIGEGYKEIEREVIVPDLPGGRNENEEDASSHELLIYENELYVTVGTTCAACEENDSRRATVMVYDLDGSNERVFARGLYYALGLAANPFTGDLWVTNQGRPAFPNVDVPETIYTLENGDWIGWPECHAGTLVDPKLGSETSCEDVKQPLLEVEAQANIADLIFYSNSEAPIEYQGDVLIALHGGVTLNEEQNGMSLLRFDLDPETGELLSTEPEDFVTGWWLSEEPGDQIGRPFGLVLGSDGTLYISDDSAGVIYRMIYKR